MNSAAAFSETISSYSPGDREEIMAALDFAEKNHAEKLSRNLGIAAILTGLHTDKETLVAALLRDHFTDKVQPRDSGDLEKRFGSLAKEAAKISLVSAKGKSAHEAENIRKMIFALASDIRTILIKLADSLHAMRTLEDFPEEDRKQIALESLDVYAPLAGRLGISWIKTELEDLSLKCLNHDAYVQIKDIVALKRGERASFLESLKSLIKEEAEKAGIYVELESRAKHFYSIYQKMRRRNKAAGDIFDLLGLRILCPGVENCYMILGLLHRLWKPVDGRFKDYIARPKPNGYQSLHTSVLVFPPEEYAEDSKNGTFSGQLLEIQIRTFEMHKTAEYGIAGHWIYKQGKAGGDISIVNRLKNRNESGNARFFEEIRRDILKDTIFVFTPQGKVISLPSGSTPLDFAYHIHSAVGEHCFAAKADGAIISLDAQLKNTQIVEIITSSASHPRENWLNEVKTAKARSKIRSWLIQHNAAMRENAKPEKAADKAVQKRKEKEPETPETGTPDPGRYSAGRDMPAFSVRVGGEKNMMVHFAKCCNPISGDRITGYVSRGRGIIIHRSGCGNLAFIPDFEERRIEARWEDAAFPVKRFKVEAKRKDTLFAEIEAAVRKFNGRLIEGKLEEVSGQHLSGYFTMQLESREDETKILRHIRGIPAVFNIQNTG